MLAAVPGEQQDRDASAARHGGPQAGPARERAADPEGQTVGRCDGGGPEGEALLGGIDRGARAGRRRAARARAPSGSPRRARGRAVGAPRRRRRRRAPRPGRRRARRTSPGGTTQPAARSASRRAMVPPSLVTTGQPAASASRKRVRSGEAGLERRAGGARPAGRRRAAGRSAARPAPSRGATTRRSRQPRARRQPALDLGEAGAAACVRGSGCGSAQRTSRRAGERGRAPRAGSTGSYQS